jgi:hypothetical protein
LRGYPVSLVLRVARLLVGDPDNGTSSSMKSNAADDGIRFTEKCRRKG